MVALYVSSQQRLRQAGPGSHPLWQRQPPPPLSELLMALGIRRADRGRGVFLSSSCRPAAADGEAMCRTSPPRNL